MNPSAEIQNTNTELEPQLSDPVQLVAAFEQFGRLSNQLQQSYNELDKRAAELTEQLASSQNERLKQLAEKEQLALHLETLLNALPAGVLFVDDRGVIKTANPAAEKLFDQCLTGKQWRKVYAKNTAKHTEQDLHLKSGRILSLKSRSLKSRNLNNSPQKDRAHDNSQGEIILLDDITEQRMFESLANRESRLSAMGQMAAGLAHQLRTPLASAILYASQLSQVTDQKNEPSRRQQNKAVEKVGTCLRYLEKLINDMLMYAKGGEFADQTFLIDQLLLDFKVRIDPQLQKNNTRLVISNQLDGEKLTGSVDALVSVLINLAENAMQACGDTACKLQLKVYRQADYLIVSMHDNGPGLSVEQQAKIFQPFYTQRNKSETHQTQGTGLGLAVAQSIVQAHHGDLKVRSQTGMGSTFYICLPLKRNERFLPSGQNVS